jgi:hypothetical protein
MNNIRTNNANLFLYTINPSNNNGERHAPPGEEVPEGEIEAPTHNRRHEHFPTDDNIPCLRAAWDEKLQM